MAMLSDHQAAASPRITRRTMLEAVLAASAASVALAASHAQGHAQATPDEVMATDPNVYVLAGDDAEFRYSTTSMTGMPMFTYTWSDGEARAAGDDIDVQPVITGGWPFGQLISIYVDAAPDAWARSVTLVLPGINLVDGNETAFTTFAVLTTHLTNIGGPAFVEGQLEEYEVIPLEGTAGFAMF